MLRVKNWSENFENHRSREVADLTWIRMPNKHDGEGFTILLTEHPDGATHYGAWVLMVQVASKCTPRGTLCRDDGTALDARALGLKTRAPRAIFEAAIPRLIEIGWLEDISDEDFTNARDDGDAPRDDADERDDAAQPRDDARPRRAKSRDAAPKRDDAAHVRDDARLACARADQRRGDQKREEKRGEARERARDPGAAAPDPAPPVSPSAGSVSEPEPEVSTTAQADEDLPNNGDTVRGQWEWVGKFFDKAPGRASKADLDFVADACPDSSRRFRAFVAVFAEAEPPPFKFVAQDIAKWVARGAKDGARLLNEQTDRRSKAIADATPADPLTSAIGGIGRTDQRPRTADEQIAALRSAEK